MSCSRYSEVAERMPERIIESGLVRVNWGTDERLCTSEPVIGDSDKL